MVERVSVHGLQVARELHDFVTHQALPGTGLDAEKFWSGFAALAAALMPQNRALLAHRDKLQAAAHFHIQRGDRPTHRQG